ncbi:MAG: hypothetical protein AAFO91_10015 [Bacteroidota bacterium]
MIRFFLFVLPLVGYFTTARAQIGALTGASDEGQAEFNRLAGQDRTYIFSELDTQPLFNEEACSSLPKDEQKACCEAAMVELVNDRLPNTFSATTPAPLMAIISLIIERDGSVSSIKFRKSPGPQYEEAYLSAVRILGANGPGSFFPGSVNNRPVRSEFHIPIRIGPLHK